VSPGPSEILNRVRRRNAGEKRRFTWYSAELAAIPADERCSQQKLPASRLLRE
jgi:hypothetical protein